MRHRFFVLLWGIAAFTLAFSVGEAAWREDAIGSVQDVYNGTLTPDIQVNTFRHIDKLFPTRTVLHGGSVYPLPKSSRILRSIPFVSGGRRHDLFDYLSLNRVSGFLVVKDGTIVLEDYELGNNDQTRWVSWSMVKSISSTLVGAAIQDGYIISLDDKVTKYLPKLAGSAYGETTIRNVLQMASGVRWDETYTNPKSDRRRMLDLQVAQKGGAILQFLGTLPRAGAPGSIWNYSTGETHLIGALVSAAVKRPLAQYLSQKIWSKFGMESDATWWLESPGGLEVGGSGLSATLRDYGRFGVFVLNGGMAGKERVVPPGWFSEAGSPKRVGNQLVNYGYMWWVVNPSEGSIHQGAFEAIGIFGQVIYINPKQHMVIVVWSARPKPTGSTAINDDDFFAAVVAALQS
ncbi:MAG: serine hydrolase [Acidobacteriaceae bacterium]|nr:serine hydrolase [Acidobacteriaceae bacterium]MBV9936875.1 serine hydrolase [Acidobacteriaceae bacterium]